MPTYYKLTQCSPGTQIIYTTADLSIYPPTSILQVNRSFCFTFEVTAPTPYIVTPIITNVFNTCEACLAPVYYKLTECAPGTNEFYTDVDLYSYLANTLSISGSCYTVSQSSTYTGILTPVTIDHLYVSCEDCTKKCYNLISCDTTLYPNLYLQSNALLESYVNQTVNINGDITKKYTVARGLQYKVLAIDTISKLCTGGITPPINYEITSFILNGVEQVITPYTYTTTSLNLQLLTCTGFTCVPAICPTSNNYTNLSDLINGFFNSLSLPLQAYPYDYNQVAINFNEGDIWTLTINYDGGLGDPLMGPVVYGVDSSNTPIWINKGVDKSGQYYNEVLCMAPVTAISSVTPTSGCNPCYTLLSCQCSLYPNLYLQSDPLLAGYVGQLININGDLTKKYTVVESTQYIGLSIDTIDSVCNGILFPGIASIVLPIDYEITSFIYNGVEHVFTPYAYSTTTLNFQSLDCTGLSCVSATCASGNVNNYTNAADMFNGFFNSLCLPLQAYPYNDMDTNRAKIAISYIAGDTFSLNVNYNGGGGNPLTISATFGVDALGNPIRLTGGYPIDNYPPSIECIAPSNPFSSINVSAPCYPCYTLTSCDGTLVVPVITDLSSYVGTNISVAEFPGECFTVVGNNSTVLCTDTIEVTGITLCDCTPDCGCPDGYILLQDGVTCQEILTVAATSTGTIYEVGPGYTPTAGAWGGLIYQDISTLTLPIAQVGNYLYDNNGTGTALTANNLLPLPSIYTIWNTRLINVGVWTTLTSGPDALPVNEWIGFSVCVEAPETKTYCIGIAADNRMRLFINGVLTVKFDAPGPFVSTYPFDAWHIIPVTLNVGTNIIKLEGYNDGGPAGFGAEIYNATPAQIIAVNTALDLEPYILYSTKNLLPPNPTAYFNTGETSGYTCPVGYQLSTCAGEVSCQQILQTPVGPCCYALTDCDSGANYVVSTDLSAYIGLTVRLNEIAGCLLVVDVAPNCDGSLTVTLSDSFPNCASCQVTPPPCYTLTDECLGTGLSFSVTNDLSASLGSVIKVCPSDLPIPNPTPINPGTPLVPFVPDDALFQYNLINCCDPSEVLIVTNTLYPYLGQTISVPVLGNKCWTVTEILLVGTSMGFIDLTGAYAYTDCGPCMGIFPCTVPYLPELLDCMCLTISESTNCTGAITLTNLGTISPTCETCAPPPPTCYELTDCKGVVDPFIVCDDLSVYLGSVIKIEGCGDTCWSVALAFNCDNSICLNGAITEFVDCETCLPPPPVPTPFALHARRIKPGYFSTNSCLTTEYIERVNCTFALEVYNQMLVNRYGITVCCDNDLDQWAIKKQVLDFELLTDPDLCKSTLNPFVPSCPDEPI